MFELSIFLWVEQYSDLQMCSHSPIAWYPLFFLADSIPDVLNSIHTIVKNLAVNGNINVLG